MEKILLMLKNEQNKKLLREYLSQHYQVFLLNDHFPPEQDLLIVDGPGFRAYQEEICKLKNQVHPLFLPSLLLTTKKNLRSYQNHLFHEIDELLTTPIEHLELLARVKTLLKTRTLSLLLEKEAITDPLTGLFNRRYFLKQGQRELLRSRRHRWPLSLLMLDLDYFKKVNDVYGHSIGDQVLIRTARRILDSIRDVDIAARYGGEEFVILLPETDAKGAMLVAERIRENIANQPFHLSPSLALSITVSVGVATLKHSFTDLHELIDLADKALYEAKKKGRNISFNLNL